MLHAHGLSIGHGSKVLLRAMDLALNPGELVALLGVNGIGKSTLLRTLGGLLRPLDGQVLLNERNVRNLSLNERARAVTMVLPGRPATVELDVEGLVALGRHPWTGRWGSLTAKDHTRVQEAIALVGADHLRGKAIGSCSDGESQLVAIARALAQDTPVILLDEPTAFLDLPNRATIVRLLRTIAHAEKKSVLFSTHDVQLALDLADRIVLMRPGQDIWTGTPMMAMGSGELQRAFAGSGIRFDAEAGTHRFVTPDDRPKP